jgi:hypothetical protein
VTHTPEHRSADDFAPTDELARRQGVRDLPLATLDIKDDADFAEHDGLELVH